MRTDFALTVVGAYDCSELVVEGLGFNRTGYPGAFTPTVNRVIAEILDSMDAPKVLHLFSGVSDIGDVRVDIARPEATHRADVLDYIKTDISHWDVVILDPPYEIKRKSKLEEYGRTSSVAADVMLRRALVQWFADYVDNIVWLDMCMPLPRGFIRKKLWLLVAGGYHTPRILSWLVRDKNGISNSKG